MSFIAEQEFKPVNQNKFGLNNGIYWFRIKLDSALIGQEIVLDIDEPSLGDIEVYGQKSLIANSKDDQIGDWNTAIQLTANVQVLYLKVDFQKNTNFPLKVYKVKKYREKRSQFNFFNGMYFGFICMVFILNLFFFFRMKEVSFLYYCFFLLTTNLAIVIYDGFLFNIIGHPIDDYIMIGFGLLIPFSGALFATHFLRLNIYFPKSKLISYFLFTVAIVFCSIYVSTGELIYYALVDAIALGILAYYWFLGVLIYKRQEFAKFFVIAYSLILGSGIFYGIPLDFGINYIDLSIDHVKFGALVETLILTYAISYRIKKMQEENDSYRIQIGTYISEIGLLKEETKSSINGEMDKEVLENKIQEIASENSLTEREGEVLSCLSKNLTNQQIADTLFVSVNTIKYHTRNIYQKLDLSNKKEVLTLFS